jgi:drug/metabolite transporter (DMT)-like permease
VTGWILLAVMVLSDASSDVLMSRGMKHVAKIPGDGLAYLFGLVHGALRNFDLLAAILLATIHFGAFLALLSFWDLSLVIPAAALDYVIATLGARFLLGETVSRLRWVGICLISTGVALASVS